MNNPSPTIRYGAERISGTDSNGYYRSHYTMDRPWCAVQNGGCLRTESGRLRRFSSASAALAAAALAARSAALNAFAESLLRDDELAVTDARADDLARADEAYTKVALALETRHARRKAMVAEWGEPCQDFDRDCHACQAWKKFDAAPAAAEITEGRHHV